MRLSAPGASIIHIDIDPSELDKIKTAHVIIAGDVAEVLRALLPKVQGRSGRSRGSPVPGSGGAPLETPGSDDPRTPTGLIAAVAARSTTKATVTTDVGQHQMWVAQAYPDCVVRAPG